MLAVHMAQSSPLPAHPNPSVTSSTMSLAILPSAPMAYSSTPLSSIPDASSPSPSKRPKLSLNTANVVAPLSIFGKGATSLRLDTLSATSPTSRNTWKNRFEQRKPMRKPTISSPTIQNSPLRTHHKSKDILPTRPNDLSSPVEAIEAASSATSSSASDSTTGSSPAEDPYRLSFNVTSILKNSPLMTTPARRKQPRPMFPAAKKVTFRSPLVEDIRTTKYTLRHSDIESSTSTISTLDLAATEDSSKETEPEKKSETSSQTSNTINQAGSPQCGDKRDSSDEEDSDACPATPVVGRKKRHREWRWTLGPVESTNEETNVQDTVTNTQDAGPS